MLRKINKPELSAAIILTMLVTFGLSAWLWLRFARAAEFVNCLNLTISKANGVVIYARPKRLTVGQPISLTEVVNHLKAINYFEDHQPDNLWQPGSYRIEDTKRISIFPRLPLPPFYPARIEFKGNKISALYQLQFDNTQFIANPVNELLLEPEQLGSLITNSNDESAAIPPLARCNPVEWQMLDGTYLLYAVMAREDPTFLTHHGISYRAIARAIWARLLGKDAGGGSTITQQVVKNAVSRDWQNSVSRKIDELFYAAALELRLSKADIFKLYANVIYLGARNGSALYGFSAAAEEHFGKSDLRSLTLSEAATLAVLLNQPGHYLREANQGNYDPILKRRALVLKEMHERWPAKFSHAAIAQAEQEPLQFVTRPVNQKSPLDNLSEEFVQNYAAKQEPLASLLRMHKPTELATVTITTTLDPDLMRTAERVIATQVPLIERRFRAANSTPQNPNRMLAAIIALDPRTGEVLTMYGGAGGKDGYKLAHPALNSASRIASLWKPFMQALAFERGLTLEDGTVLTPDSIVDAAASSVNGWQPRIGTGAPASLRVMMAGSRDDYAAFLTARLGLPVTVDFFENVSGRSINDPNYEVCLGLHPQMALSPLKVARAYTLLARGGSMIEPTPFSRITLNNHPISLPVRQSKELLKPESVRLTTEMMCAVTGAGEAGEHGTLRAAFARAGLSASQSVWVAKTGSGPEAVWAVALSKQLVIVTWLGYERSPIANLQEWQEQNAIPTNNFTAGQTVGHILAQYLKAIQPFPL